MTTTGMIVTTANALEGRRVTDFLGVVHGKTILMVSATGTAVRLS